MNKSFNGLTPAEAERLAMLAEEAGEIVQIVGKILRHGYFSYHPSDAAQTTNRQLLEKEIADLSGIHLEMIWRGDIQSPGDFEASARQAWARKLRYTHHQS